MHLEVVLDTIGLSFILSCMHFIALYFSYDVHLFEHNEHFEDLIRDYFVRTEVSLHFYI